MVDMGLLVFQYFHIYRRGRWSQNLPLKIFLSSSLGDGGGGRYFSDPSNSQKVGKRQSCDVAGVLRCEVSPFCLNS